MNLLVSLVPLLILVSWNGQHAGALPAEDRLALMGDGALAKVQRDFLLTMLSERPELRSQEKEAHNLDREQLRQPRFGERSLAGQPIPRERSPCKNFFWKTFSSC